jgi:hypothetical protein
VAPLRIGGDGADACAAHALNTLARALGACVVKVGLRERSGGAAAIDSGEEKRGGAFEDGKCALTHEIREADVDDFFTAANGEYEICVWIKFNVKARRATFAAEASVDALEEGGAVREEAVVFSGKSFHCAQENYGMGVAIGEKFGTRGEGLRY